MSGCYYRTSVSVVAHAILRITNLEGGLHSQMHKSSMRLTPTQVILKSSYQSHFAPDFASLLGELRISGSKHLKCFFFRWNFFFIFRRKKSIFSMIFFLPFFRRKKIQIFDFVDENFEVNITNVKADKSYQEKWPWEEKWYTIDFYSLHLYMSCR